MISCRAEPKMYGSASVDGSTRHCTGSDVRYADLNFQGQIHNVISHKISAHLLQCNPTGKDM